MVPETVGWFGVENIVLRPASNPYEYSSVVQLLVWLLYRPTFPESCSVSNINIYLFTLEFMEPMLGIKTNAEATLKGGELELIDF